MDIEVKLSDIRLFFTADLTEVNRKLDLLTVLVRQVIAKENHMSKEMDDLAAEVTRNQSVVQSVLAVVQGLADQLAAAGTDPVKLQALHDQLMANDDLLAAAVAANTPAAPPPPPAPNPVG